VHCDKQKRNKNKVNGKVVAETEKFSEVAGMKRERERDRERERERERRRGGDTGR